MNSFMNQWWNLHPVPKRGRKNRKWVDFIFAHPLFLMGSLSMMHRWDILFNYRIPSKAHKQMWDVYGIVVRRKTRCVLLTRTSMCALLVCKLIGFRGMFQPNQLKYLAKCVVTPFHFIGKTKNEAEYLFQEGKKMLKQSSYRATEMFEKASLLMHPKSNAVLSNMMFESSCPMNDKLSFKYAALGERMGCRHSKGLLAKCYIYGKGVIKDVAKGLALAKESAKTGSCYGQSVLAMCYRNGINVSIDYIEAVRLLHLSAGQGYVIAQFELGQMYEFGIGIAQDDSNAVRWYSLAAEQDHFFAKYHLCYMRHDGLGGA